MDTRHGTQLYNPIVVTGLDHAVRSPMHGSQFPALEDPLELITWLKNKRLRKFMGQQDVLAVIASGKAVGAAQVAPALLENRTGIFMAVGYIPFEKYDMDILAENSQEDQNFSMEMLSTAGFARLNPLLTFKCLPNMPLFHTSINLGIKGPYFIVYPGIGQFYLALERALVALNTDEIDIALVGGVAHQNNHLVELLFERIDQCGVLADAAGFMVLEKKESAMRRGITPKLQLNHYSIGYKAHDPLEGMPRYTETLCDEKNKNLGTTQEYLGVASLPVRLGLAMGQRPAGDITHEVNTYDGITARSSWSPL